MYFFNIVKAKVKKLLVFHKKSAKILNIMTLIYQTLLLRERKLI